MFCVTFYSYKGGVGRSLALANAAALLALQGKRVLIVDFDLEAPGLTTLRGFESAAGRPGIVDYVHDYLATGSAPDPEDYVHRCELTYDPSPDERHDLLIDVMPAGKDDDNYSERFASIDWNDLYTNRNGFLLMENLRAGWERAGYDYVLIDSRTGHTDVSGICTRQLPDAVVAVFFPNEQNLLGLSQIVRGVRSAGARPRPINVMFVASRVPRLDDEHGHLRRWLDRFQEVLEYDARDLTIIEHYDSLMLLNQSLFVLDRPRSGLAQQYGQLVGNLAQLNPQDAAGAFMVANGIANTKQSTSPVPKNWRSNIEGRLDAIAKAHTEDGIVQYALARAYYRLRRLQEAARATDYALANVDQTFTGRPIDSILRPSIHRIRIRIFSELESYGEVAASATAILEDGGATRTMIIDALRAIGTLDPDAADAVARTRAITEASPELLLSISTQLSDSPSSSRLAGLLSERALQADTNMESQLYSALSSSAQISLIAGGRFDEAVAAGERTSRSPETLVGVFNTAIARWGRDGHPDREEFERVLEFFGDDPLANLTAANRLQCLALVHAVLGNPDDAKRAAAQARAIVKAEMQRDFSCWTYFTVSTAEFEEHLDAIVAFATQSGSPPEVLVRSWNETSSPLALNPDNLEQHGDRHMEA